MFAKSSDIEEYLDFKLEHKLGVFEVGRSILLLTVQISSTRNLTTTMRKMMTITTRKVMDMRTSSTGRMNIRNTMNMKATSCFQIKPLLKTRRTTMRM